MSALYVPMCLPDIEELVLSRFFFQYEIDVSMLHFASFLPCFWMDDGVRNCSMNAFVALGIIAEDL